MIDETPQIFDRPLYLARQASASGTEFLQQHVADELNDRLSLILRRLPKTLLIAQHLSIILPSLKATGKCDEIICVVPSAAPTLNVPQHIYDCVISILDLHCVNDVPGHLAQLGRSLKPDGLLLVAFFAGETLYELRQSWLEAEVTITGGASPRVAPMIGVRELGGLMQRANLALPVADVEKTTLRYADVFALMREIKLYGYANPLLGRNTKLVSKRLLATMAEYYHTHFSDADSRIKATVEIAWAMAWKPHESQQKSLKPGSAKARLADALNSLTNVKDNNT
jgi:SAM-dependent methyltransferase